MIQGSIQGGDAVPALMGSVPLNRTTKRGRTAAASRRRAASRRPHRSAPPPSRSRPPRRAATRAARRLTQRGAVHARRGRAGGRTPGDTAPARLAGAQSHGQRGHQRMCRLPAPHSGLAARESHSTRDARAAAAPFFRRTALAQRCARQSSRSGTRERPRLRRSRRAGRLGPARQAPSGRGGSAAKACSCTAASRSAFRRSWRCRSGRLWCSPEPRPCHTRAPR
eukprot:4281420-Prymnesium_polylepis.2